LSINGRVFISTFSDTASATMYAERRREKDFGKYLIIKYGFVSAM